MTVDEIDVVEHPLDIKKVTMTRKGVNQIKPLNPNQRVEAETVCATNNAHFVPSGNIGNMVAMVGSQQVTVISRDKAVLKVSKVDFGKGAKRMTLMLRGKGSVEIHKGSPDGQLLGRTAVNTNDWRTAKCSIKATGEQDVVFVMKGESLQFDYWICE